MNRKAIRDLAARELKIKTPNYLYASSLDELIISVNKIGVPCVIKPLMSSSGKGQSIIRTKTDIETAWKAAEKGRGDSSKVIVEEFVDFESEITLLTVTQKNGETLFCQPIGHLQERGDYQESWQPALVTAEQLADAQNIAKKVTAALGGEGIWGVEFFLTKDAVYFSELSPRPHDTGMVTLANTQNFNQFELHARAVLSLDIPQIDFQKSGASVAILTESIGTTPKYCGLEEAAKIANSDFRIFGKPITRPYRRMGVALAYGPLDADMKEIRKTAKEVASKIKVK
jgi:phosphoribosylglycinamide formyltransferase 2